MTKSSEPPEPQLLELFQYLFKHCPRDVLHHSQIADKLGIPIEPFQQIVDAGLNPSIERVSTPRNSGQHDFWFEKVRLGAWRIWFLTGSTEELTRAKNIVVAWDKLQLVRDYSFLDDYHPHEYFRYFLDREYMI